MDSFVFYYVALGNNSSKNKEPDELSLSGFIGEDDNTETDSSRGEAIEDENWLAEIESEFAEKRKENLPKARSSAENFINGKEKRR